MKASSMKKVLIALDYDPTAQKVAEGGFSLAKAMGAEIVLLHIITEPVYYSSTEYSPILGFTEYHGNGTLQLDSVEGLQKASQHFLDKTKHHLGDNSIKTLIKEGDIAESILKAAKDLHADIIVMGSHSRKWLEKIVLGSVAEKTLDHTTIPLFFIPTKKHH
ncbi:MAG: universal stress protein [Bacteroidetes bacterium]|nr:universal stress protein [Bacteroidota bacterium]